MHNEILNKGKNKVKAISLNEGIEVLKILKKI